MNTFRMVESCATILSDENGSACCHERVSRDKRRESDSGTQITMKITSARATNVACRYN